jgi:uncharacterized protein YcnI
MPVMKIALLALTITALPAVALAHVVIQPGAAAPGSIVEASVIAGHGCAALPTTAVTVTIPDGIGMVHVMETEGWTAKTIEKASHVASVTWTTQGQGTAASQAFKMHIELPKVAGRIFFPAVQTCGDTVVKWDEQTGDKPTHPAPSINVGGAAAPAADMSKMDHSH